MVHDLIGSQGGGVRQVVGLVVLWGIKWKRRDVVMIVWDVRMVHERRGRLLETRGKKEREIRENEKIRKQCAPPRRTVWLRLLQCAHAARRSSVVCTLACTSRSLAPATTRKAC